MLTSAIGEYSLTLADGEPPALLDQYLENARLVEQIDTDREDGRFFFAGVAKDAGKWPFLVVLLRYRPAGNGFHPGVALIPETDTLFLGAGERVLIYDLANVRQLRVDTADTGFWAWQRHGDILLMSAELELAAWNVRGEKLWSTFVEPPWSFEVKDGQVSLDVMGRQSHFLLAKGP
jgi:hypothetical protein